MFMNSPRRWHGWEAKGFDSGTPVPPTIDSDMVVESDDGLHVFSAASGRWATLSLPREDQPSTSPRASQCVGTRSGSCE